jgi:hypothetical protein
MQHSAESTHNRDFLREIETEFENILGVYQGPRGHRFMKKMEVENLVRLSL